MFKVVNQNIKAADTTINEYVTKAGDYVAEKEVWILEEKKLM